MAIIKNFPSRSVREISRIERSLRKHLQTLGLSKEMEDEIMAGMKKFMAFNDASLNFQDENRLSFSDEQLLFVADKMHKYTFAITMERLAVEIELYNFRHQDEF